MTTYPSLHIGLAIVTYQFTTSWKDDIQPPPNPEFIELLESYYYTHISYAVIYMMNQALSIDWLELVWSALLLNYMCLFYITIEASVAHFKHANKMYYKFYQIEDNAHFLMLIEIAIIATSLMVIMIVLFFSSIINQK